GAGLAAEQIVAGIAEQPVGGVVAGQRVVTGAPGSVFDVGVDGVALAGFAAVGDTVEIDAHGPGAVRVVDGVGSLPTDHGVGTSAAVEGVVATAVSREERLAQKIVAAETLDHVVAAAGEDRVVLVVADQ